MNLKSTPTTLLIVSLCAQIGLSSQMVNSAEEPLAFVDTLPTYVVVATRTPLGLDRVSPSVTYIGAGEMESWQDSELVDTLARVPGILLTTYGAPGNVASMFLRGAESDQTALFLDGRRLNPTFSGQYGLESISLSNLDNVQVLKGGASVNYGSSGIGGVIDLRTRTASIEDGTRGSIKVETGSNDYYRVGLDTSFSDDRIAFSLGSTYLETENERANDAYNYFSATPSFNLRINDVLSLELITQYTETQKELPGSISFSSTSDYLDSESWLISPGVRYATDLLSAHFFYSHTDYSAEGVQYSPVYNEVVGDNLNLQVNYSAADSLLLTAGAVYRKDDIYRRGLYQNTVEQAGLFVQSIWQVNDQLELRTGFLFHKYTDYDDSTTGSLELIYTLEDCHLSIFGKLATAYAPPSGQDLAYDENIDSLGSAANTPLNPEESVSYELGLRQKLLEDNLQWSLVVFRNEIDNLITYEDYSYYDTNFNYIYVGSDTYNVGEATTEGIEFSVDYAFSEKIDLALGYTYLTANNDAKNMRLAYRPRHQLQLTATYRPAESLSLGFSGVGYSDRERGRYLQSNTDVEDYYVVNFVADWSINDHWSLFARVENLLDEQYAPQFGYPALGRAGYIGARFEF